MSDITNESHSRREARAIWRWLALVAALGGGGIGCHSSPPGSPTPPGKTQAPGNETPARRNSSNAETPVATQKEKSVKLITVDLDRLPAAGEAVQARITVGSLPIGAKLIVRTKDGTIAGTIVNYGPKRPGETSIHSVSIPRRSISDRHLTLALAITMGTPDGSRAPTDSEVVMVDVVIVESTSTEAPAP
jgi:hypothetical protein